MPAEAFEAGHLVDLRADRECDVPCQRNPLKIFRDVEIGLVQRQRFDDGRVLGEDLPDLLRDGLIDLETRLHEDQVRALPLRGHRRHGRSDAELSCFIACRRHDAALAGSADGDRLATEIRIVPLLHGCVEGVHVDVDDLALTGRGPRLIVVFVAHAVGPAGSSLTPRASAETHPKMRAGTASTMKRSSIFCNGANTLAKLLPRVAIPLQRAASRVVGSRKMSPMP
jgi:hypothetical protein